jgi:regulatory protein
MQRDDGVDAESGLAPVIDLFGGRRRRGSEASAPSAREVDAGTGPPTVQAPRAAAPDEVPEDLGSSGGHDAQGWWVEEPSSSAEGFTPAAEPLSGEEAVRAESRSRAAAVAASRWSGQRAEQTGSARDDSSSEERPLPRLDIEEASTWALSRRGLSVVEMRQKLAAKGYAEEAVESEIDRLMRVRYLDDARLAEEVVRVEVERKGKGRAVVIGELRRRGISPDDYAAALDEIDTELELDRAVDIAYRKMSSSRDLDTRTAERRLSALLARRGFSGDLARAAIARATERMAGGN